MPIGPDGEKRPTDVVANAVHAMRVAIGNVALAFSRVGCPMTDTRTGRLLARHPGDPAKMLSILNAKGFVWQDDDDQQTTMTTGSRGFRISWNI